LKQKALSAVENYKVDMVIANQLATSRSKVQIYQPSPTEPEGYSCKVIDIEEL
jgi:hypothetical protein